MRTRPALTSLTCVLTVLVAGAGSSSAAQRACPGTNAPNELVLAGGSGQTTQLGNAFPAPLEVQLANTNGCPLTGNLAGRDVTFDAPATGAGGTFTGTGSREAVVGTNAQGVATAPPLVANFTAGGYSVVASSDVGTVDFSLSNTAAGLPAAISATAGTPQEAPVNGAYAQSLQARVVDANGNPVQGATVTFSVVFGTTGAGAVFLGGGQATATTDANGVATSPPLAANGSAGRFAAVASTNGVSSVARYSLDNHAVAQTLRAVGSTRLSSTVDSRYPGVLAVRLLDAAGAPVEGASVGFTLDPAASSGGGAGAGDAAGATFVGGSSQTTVVTNANGEAATPRIVANGTPGAFTAIASVSGSSASLTYALHNLPARLVAVAPVRSATVGGRYAHALRVRARGAGGKPVAGVRVTFTIGKASDNASATFPDGTSLATATTNGAGIAVAPPMTANGIAGAFTATASVPGGGPVAYRLRNVASRPATIAPGAADGTSTGIGSTFPIRLAVTVDDASGNPVAGVVVRFSGPHSGAGGHFTTRAKRAARTVRVRTNVSGVAIAPPFTANAVAGGYAVQVRAGSTRAAFALVNQS